MNLSRGIGISLVVLFASDRYTAEMCLPYNNSDVSCRAPDFGWRSGDENLDEDGNHGHRENQQASSGNQVDQDGGSGHDNILQASRSGFIPITEKDPPLVLTPYVRKKKFHEGAEAARVSTVDEKVESYSGFFKVNNRRGSCAFFWYFTPLHQKLRRQRSTPIIMWVPGMGESSMFSAFRDHGPIRLLPFGKMKANEWSWATNANLVYFDSPGTGFGHTRSGIYPTTHEQVAKELYIALRQFLRLFNLTRNPLFIAGQGYAGKTVIALGALIHKQKKAFPINFKGVAIGNGFIDPPRMLQYGKYLYQLGFIGEETRNEFYRVRKTIKKALKENPNSTEALNMYALNIQDTLLGRPSLIDAETELVSKLNFTQVRRVFEEQILSNHLNGAAGEALHADGVPFVQNRPEVLKAIWPDLLKPQVRNLKRLMNNYRVLFYQGQMSILNGYPLVIQSLKHVRWSERWKYLQAERIQWRVKGELAGYYKKGGRFTELLMRNAGCRVSADQPEWALRMITNFIYNKDFNSEH